MMSVGCLANVGRGGRHQCKGDPIPQSLNPLGEPIDGIAPPPFVDVACSSLVLRFTTREHVKDTDHDGRRDGSVTQRLLLLWS